MEWIYLGLFMVVSHGFIEGISYLSKKRRHYLTKGD
jgi:hypothetical protein